MATAYPLDLPPLPANDRASAANVGSGRTVELGRAYAEHLQATEPAYFASLGLTVEAYAVRFAEPGMTLDESVAAGHMSAAESRYIQFCATREDLIELGHTPEEILSILEEQQAHACASSS